MSRVHETLATWREGERRLEAAKRPDEISRLKVEVERLRREYLRAAEPAGNDEDTVAAQFVIRPQEDLP